MHAYAFIGTDEDASNSANEHAKKIAKKIFIEDISKISELRELLQNVSLSYSEPTAVILNNFDKASTEAQNAFLKKLEEPQENLFFILTAKNEFGLLPTILSRINVKRLKSEKATSDIEFFQMSKPEKLEKIYEIKKREDAIEFVSQILTEARSDSKNYIHIDLIEEVYKRLQANGNASVQMSYLISHLDSS